MCPPSLPDAGCPPANLIATYHYVRPANSDGVTGLTPDAFRTQITAIQAHYEIVAPEIFIRERTQRTGLALITFDDAVRDQFTYAAPVLLDCHAPAVFFAPMRPFDPMLADQPAAQWIPQHLLHALAETLGWDQLEDAVDETCSDLRLDVRLDEDAMNRLYHYEIPRKRRLKYLLAFALDHATATTILTRINTQVGLRASDWFMSREQLVELERAGHLIGGHGYDHMPYSTMTPDQQRCDLHHAFTLQSQLLGRRPRPLAYPFGRSTPQTEAIARSVGYTECFGTEERIDARDVLGFLESRRSTHTPSSNLHGAHP